jgi:hypothetical protein
MKFLYQKRFFYITLFVAEVFYFYRVKFEYVRMIAEYIINN